MKSKYVKWVAFLGMSGFWAIAAQADVEITSSGVYRGSIQSDQGNRFNQISYVVRVPQGKHVHISIVGSQTISQTTGSCSNTASFDSAGSYRTHVFDANLNRMTTYDSFSDTRIDMASKCSPEQLPRPSIGYYESFYAKLDFEISVTYEDVCPDLEVASIVAKSDFIIEDDKLIFEVVVKNRGYSSAAASKVTIVDNGKKVGTYDVVALSAGASASHSFETAALTEGEHVFSFTVGKVAEEKVTSNNFGTRTILVNGHSPYKVYFDANGGSGRMDPGDFVQGVPQKLPRNLFTREWFRFKGWSRSRYYGSVDFIDEAMLERMNVGEAGGVTLYAVWEEVERVTVKFFLNGANTRTEREAVQSAWLELEEPMQALAELVGTLISECDRYSSKALRISEAKTLVRKVLDDYSTGRESYSIPSDESYWAWRGQAQDFVRYGICGWGAARYGWDYTLVKNAFDIGTGDDVRMMNLTAALVTKIDEIRNLNREIDAKDFLCELATEKWGRMAKIPKPGWFEGITFSGWWTEPEGGSLMTASSVFAKDQTLYAHWAEGDVGIQSPIVRLSVADNSFALEWNCVDGAVTYEIFRTNAMPPFKTSEGITECIANVKALKFENSEFLMGQGCSYYVRAIAEDGRQSESEVITVALLSDQHWAENGYAVRFYSDGGTRLVSLIQMECGRVYDLPSCMLQPPTGKRFAGWACSNGRRYDDGVLVFNLAQPGETVTMTAIWE